MHFLLVGPKRKTTPKQFKLKTITSSIAMHGAASLPDRTNADTS